MTKMKLGVAERIDEKKDRFYLLRKPEENCLAYSSQYLENLSRSIIDMRIPFSLDFEEEFIWMKIFSGGVKGRYNSVAIGKPNFITDMSEARLYKFYPLQQKEREEFIDYLRK